MPFKILYGTVLLFTLFCLEGECCTRVLYSGADGVVVTGRSMDWMEDMHSNIWVFPKGMKRNGEVNDKSPVWTSKYGSVIVSGYDVGSADGMNEMGLVANMLYLTESKYGELDKTKHPLSISLWAQYVLDNFATVKEAVVALKEEPFQIVAPTLPNGSPAALHLSISDSKGNSAIFEYLDGNLVVHEGPQYTVMTNSPSFDQQLALDSYWKEVGGTVFLPGTNRAADRFARASFLIGVIPTEKDPHFITAVPEKEFQFQAVASVLSVVRSVSVPLGITTPKEPNIASTLWRTVADQKNLLYYFDSATTPNTFWIPLKDLDLNVGAPVMKLEVAGGMVYAGNAVKELKRAEPFKFLQGK